MQSKTSTVLNTLHAVQEFMTTNADALGTLNDSASRHDLDEIEGALSGHAVAQARSKNGRKSAVTRKRVVKNTLLVKYLRPISAISEAKLNQSPDFVELKLPKNTRTTPQLLAAAEAMAEAAAKHATVFIAAGMAPTFVADLQAAVNDVKAAEASKGATLTSQLGASKALGTTAQQAQKVVKQLDALIEPLLVNNTALLVKWKATKRFTGRAVGVSAAATDTAHTTAPSQQSGPTPSATPLMAPSVPSGPGGAAGA